MNIITIHRWAPSSLCSLRSDISTGVYLVLRFVQTCLLKDKHIGIWNEAVVALKLVKVSLYEVPDLISLPQYEFMPSDGAPLALLT